ncbi:exo-beta-1,3-glucanase [Epithele typhae]|uniref:exo-beta-1,3-glucanase n=1 Tax=Epithele typhae TaxID=378194 RepID=UPI0020077151|nr:exo-beta-1,3-glucanase [Epithele typhae]KAH9932038.1 exo-beta-1,3-glucanase [Epithele typhae]
MVSARSTFTSLLTSASLLVGLFAPAALADSAINPSFPYGSSKIRGVNVGGWLVLEPWITPSLFDATNNKAIIDEWTFTQLQDYNTAKAALTQHWNTWITKADFAAIAAAGLNHVRIPIGYWAFDVGPGEPYISGQLPYLQQAVGWARSSGLKVIVDLHGAPGSQNGYDNSGHLVAYPQWQANSTNIARTNAIVKTLASLFVNDLDVVTAIEPLNEPAGYYGSDILTPLKQFYYDSYGNIRYPYGSSKQSNYVSLIHDAFQPLSYWKGFQLPPNWQGVMFDTHIYQMFVQDQVSRTNEQHIQAACAMGDDLASFDLWVVVGEWTPAQTDCAVSLNGRGKGARYDGTLPGSTAVGSCAGLTGSGAGFSSDYKTFLRQYWEAQTITYERNGGWLQWAWKAENADEWSYQAGLKYGWIPQNPTDRKYPNICG